MPWVISLFSGLQVIVTAIIAHAAYSFGRGIVHSRLGLMTAIASSGLLLAGVEPFVVIIASAAAGAYFLRKEKHASETSGDNLKKYGTAKNALLPLLFSFAALLILSPSSHSLSQLAVTMFKVDLFAFGGGFASVPLMLHEIVTVRGWMDGKTFMDGIALGQITPGPIVITTTFVGYVLYGFSGAVVATIAVFTPSLLILIAAAPVFERLRSSPHFQGAIKGTLASFVGLLLFVTFRFGTAVPWDIARVLLACAALAALVKKTDILYVVLLGAAVSTVLF